MKIWAHTLVKNEARWLWFSVASVVNHVDRILLWDTGSTDGTIDIIKELQNYFPGKIEFKKRVVGSPAEFPVARQEMLNETKSDWFMVLDGDEVWWEDSISKFTDAIRKNGENYESAVVPMIYPIGDIFHKQDESAGHYKLVGKTGNFALRGVNRNIPGLSSSNPHGTWGWTDKNGVMIQDRDQKKILFVNNPYMHFSLIPRAVNHDEDAKVMKRAKKLKYEIGQEFPKDFFYPEVFFKKRPNFIPSPWMQMDNNFKFRAFIETPLRKIKRGLVKSKVGY